MKLSEGHLQLLVFWLDSKCLVCRDRVANISTIIEANF